MFEFSLTVAVCLIQLGLGLMGVYVALKPPPVEYHRHWIGAFLGVGLLGVALTAWLAQSSSSTLNEILHNTAKPPTVVFQTSPEELDMRKQELEIWASLTKKAETGGNVPLKKRVNDLADEIHNFVSEWKKSEPTNYPDPTKPDYQTARQQFDQNYLRYLGNVTNNYDKQFGGRVTYAIEEMRAQGVKTGAPGVCIWPNTAMAMTLCADQLKADAQKLP